MSAALSVHTGRLAAARLPPQCPSAQLQLGVGELRPFPGPALDWVIQAPLPQP